MPSPDLSSPTTRTSPSWEAILGSDSMSDLNGRSLCRNASFVVDSATSGDQDVFSTDGGSKGGLAAR